MPFNYNGEVRAYLLALQESQRPNRPHIPSCWQEIIEEVESIFARSDGDGGAVKLLLSARSKLNTDLAKLLASEQPPTPARGEASSTLTPQLQEALSNKDSNKVFECVSEIAVFDDVALAKFKWTLRNIFGSTFHMREFMELLWAEKRRIEAQNRKRPIIKSAHDLMSIQFPEKSWIVPGILPPGLIALAGKQKIGKSWLDLSLSLAVGGGGKAFGSIDVEQGDVLYLALEDNEQRLQDRWRQLLGPDETMPARIEYATEWPRMNKDGVEALEEWIQSKPNPRLVVIDPWVKVKPRIKARQGETGYDADYEALEGIKRLADTYNVCILVQFHVRKASAEDPFDELNGTSGITACADGYLALKRARGESDAVLWGTGRDYREDVDLALKFDNGYWNVLGDAKEYALSKASKEIIDALEQADRPLYPKDLAKLLGIPEGTIRKRLFDMKNRDEVKDTGKGYTSISFAHSGNGGNRVTQTHVKQDGEPHEGRYLDNIQDVTFAEWGKAHQATVTSPVQRYLDDQNEVTVINPGVEPPDEAHVTPLRALPHYANVNSEAQQLLMEVQELFKERAGIRQIWRDDINPVRQFLPDAYLKKVRAAIDSGDLQSIELAATAMKWTTGRLLPGREKEPTPLQG